MDHEVENVIKLIFPNGIPDDWKENRDFSHYVTKLGSMGVDQLGKEPDRLKEDQDSVLAQTQELAFANYKTFIETAECSRNIFQKLNKSEQNLQSLLEGLPKLSITCENFIHSSVDISIHRRLNSLTLKRNAQLLEILELPQLMDTCIRNGCYEDALELAAYVRRLGKKHNNIPIIANVVHEVESSWLSMLQQLLSVLRTDVPLPRVLQVVGFLRRMELFTEAELRLKFLQCRDSWLQSMISAVPNDDAQQHLSRVVELSRVHLFSIITQYRAVFGDSDADLSHSSSIHSTLFYTWIMEKVLQFLVILEQDLSRGVGTSFDSLVKQCMYFGLSLSRVGADFRAFMAPIFVKAILQNLEVSVLKASRKFEQDMETFSLPKTQFNIARTFGTELDTNEEHPPEALLEFRPLADYCNNILMALNELRLCTPIALAASVTTHMQNSLCSVSRSMLAFYRQEQQALTSIEKEAFTRFCSCLADHLVPFLQRCLHGIFSSITVATHLGVGVHRLQKEGITFLDRSIILDPISHLLPVKVELSAFPVVQIQPNLKDNNKEVAPVSAEEMQESVRFDKTLPPVVSSLNEIGVSSEGASSSS